MQKSDGPWRMTVDHHELKHVVTAISAAVLVVVSLLEQINTVPGTLYAATGLANAFLTTSLQ